MIELLFEGYITQMGDDPRSDGRHLVCRRSTSNEGSV